MGFRLTHSGYYPFIKSFYKGRRGRSDGLLEVVESDFVNIIEGLIKGTEFRKKGKGRRQELSMKYYLL